MKKFNIQELEGNGFAGFISISDLKAQECEQVPNEKGVYVVYRKSTDPPRFLDKSIGCKVKGNPTVECSKLKEKWVAGANVIYIGQAGGKNAKSTLSKRIKKYIKFGKGDNANHWGGRYIWQMKDSDNLLLAWKVCPDSDPRKDETKLISEFMTSYDKKPFANLRK